MLSPSPDPASSADASAEPVVRPLDMVEVLKARRQRHRARPKRARTRARILAATAEEIAHAGYPALTVERISARAEIARGTFYLYYAHRSDAAIAVYRLFWAILRRWRPRLVARDLPTRVRQTNAFYVETYARNHRLLGGQIALAGERPNFALVRDQVNHRWARVVARILPSELDEEARTLRARALTGMVDDLLRDIFSPSSPTLAHWRKRPRELADHISEIWLSVISDTALQRPR